MSWIVLTALPPYWVLLKTRGRGREIDAPILDVGLTETTIRLRVEGVSYCVRRLFRCNYAELLLTREGSFAGVRGGGRPISLTLNTSPEMIRAG